MRHAIRLIAMVFALGLSGPVMAGPFEDGLAAAQRGDFATALRLWQPLADQGYVGAQFNLGVMYRDDLGVPRDYQEAVKWFRLAAEQGNANAQFNLGRMYFNGHGVPQDYAEAVMWFRGAADKGTAIAQYALAAYRVLIGFFRGARIL